jgi:hypothetical protein
MDPKQKKEKKEKKVKDKGSSSSENKLTTAEQRQRAKLYASQT